MPRITSIGYTRCLCGSKHCQDYWLTGLGHFVQGSGFTLEEADEVSRAVVAVRAQGRRARRSELQGVPRDGALAFSSGWDVRSCPLTPCTPESMRWVSDWWRASADAFESHIYGEDA